MATSEHPADERLRQLWHKRYRAEQLSSTAWNETLNVLLSHRSVRAYLPKPLPEGTLETLIAAAQSASSSSNLQAWSVVAVEDTGRKSRLATLARNQSHIVQAPLFLVWLIDLNRLGQLAAARDEPSAGLDYLESFLMGAVDTSLAAQIAVVALESLGLGAVYIGAIRNKPAQVAAELDLPPNVFALFGLCVGWPDPARPASNRVCRGTPYCFMNDIATAMLSGARSIVTTGTCGRSSKRRAWRPRTGRFRPASASATQGR